MILIISSVVFITALTVFILGVKEQDDDFLAIGFFAGFVTLFLGFGLFACLFDVSTTTEQVKPEVVFTSLGATVIVNGQSYEVKDYQAVEGFRNNTNSATLFFNHNSYGWVNSTAVSPNKPEAK